MKIVHVETGRNLYGGAQQVLYLCAGLQARNVESSLVCMPDSDVYRAALRLGIALEPIFCGGDLDILFMSRLRRYLIKQRPDVVHCHSRRGADFFGGRAARGLKIPAILSRRVDSVEPRITSRLRFALFERIVAISDNVRGSLAAAGVADEKIEMIRSAVQTPALVQRTSRDEWQSQFKLTKDNIVALVAAQLIERKGHRILLQALRHLVADQPQFRVIIFGKGPLEKTLKQVVADFNLRSFVQFAGYRGDLDSLFSLADMLIHPASQEGLGVAMLKAAAAGLPVVAFAIGGAKEAVVDGETGLLVAPRDADGLLQAIRRLIENPRLRESLGQNGRARMRREFTIDEMVSKHIQLYKSITSAVPR